MASRGCVSLWQHARPPALLLMLMLMTLITLMMGAQGVPWWVGNGSNFFTQDNINYHLDWIRCAQQHGASVSYMGVWNERAWQGDWIVGLRQALDANGFQDTVIVAADDGDWSVADALAANSTLNASVGIVGVHYPFASGRFPDSTARSLGKRLWASEEWDLGKVDDFDGAMRLAQTINGNFIYGDITATIVWCVIDFLTRWTKTISWRPIMTHWYASSLQESGVLVVCNSAILTA